MTERIVTSAMDYAPDGYGILNPNYGQTLRGIISFSGNGDSIVFAPGITEIDLVDKLTIIAGQGVTIDGTIAGSSDTVSIVSKGGVTGFELDGADVTLENLVITQADFTPVPLPAEVVGGIDIDGGNVSLENLDIKGNYAFADEGEIPEETAGGVRIRDGAHVVISGSTIESNGAYSSGSGVQGYDAAGGVLVDGSYLHIVNSLLQHNNGKGGEGGGTRYASYRGGDGVGGILARNGSTVIADTTSIYNNGGTGGLGAAGFTDVGGGIVGGHGGYGVGGVYEKGSTLTLNSSPITRNYGTGGIGGRGGSPVGYGGHHSGPGEGGSGGGAGGRGVGGLLVDDGSGVAYAYALNVSGNHATGGAGGYGGVGGNGVHPGSYAVGVGGGGGAGGAAGQTGFQGHPGSGGAIGGAGGDIGESGAGGHEPQVSDGSIYSGGAGGGGGGGGTAIAQSLGQVQSIACFVAGTRIATPQGACPVETLRVGQAVRTAGGADARIVWLGHRRIDCRRHPRPWDVLPVRVRAGAFAEGLPARDLLLSPDHAVLADGVLIPVRYLINGTTIARQDARAVTYWHVELRRHDILLAEGLPCESYLDTGNRGAFVEGGPALALHPDFAPPDFAMRVWQAEACARLVRDGAELEATRSVLMERAEALGYQLTGEADLHLVVDGRILRPEIDGQVYRFGLPSVYGAVRLASRCGIPAETGLAQTDARRLGVAISRLLLDGRAVALDDPRLGAGWHAPEGGDGKDAAPGWRWTDGNAMLDIAGVRRLGVEIAMVERYWVEGTLIARCG